jgi:hypothetical protein
MRSFIFPLNYAKTPPIPSGYPHRVPMHIITDKWIHQNISKLLSITFDCYTDIFINNFIRLVWWASAKLQPKYQFQYIDFCVGGVYGSFVLRNYKLSYKHKFHSPNVDIFLTDVKMGIIFRCLRRYKTYTKLLLYLM